MLVRMIATAAGPPGLLNAKAGTTVELTKARAQELIDGGFALDEAEWQRRQAERRKQIEAERRKQAEA